MRAAFRVTGIVQGVGFRPRAHGHAVARSLVGWVANDDRGVVGEVEGPADAVHGFLAALADEPPRRARVDHLDWEEVPAVGGDRFVVVRTRSTGRATAAIGPDLALCDACRAEVDDRADRRWRHPFASCTDCGPRLTIVVAPPYDRARTTMAPFPLCAACAAEYEDPADRRFHAEATCCPACGPRLAWWPQGADDPLAAAARRLAAGGVVVVKGLGGHHLAARADHADAVARVRAIKRRDERPMAVLVADLAAARRLCHLDPAAEALLAGPRAPIVLAPRRVGAPVAEAVAPGTDLLGVLLPYTPLHHLLVAEAGGPLVLTSANPSGEPMVVDDGAARALVPAADAVLTHDRAIALRVDDSVARVVDGAPRVLRRARGYAPEPVALPHPVDRPVLAVGGDLKATACLAAGDRAWLSPHLGDLRHPAARDAHAEALDRLVDLVGVAPEVVAHDRHPGYASTTAARAWAERHGLATVAVQHHHAHVAAALAEHGRRGPAVGLAFDGTGWGPDGTSWGGEVLVVGPDGAERMAGLDPVALPGGEAAVAEPWRMAAAYLDAAGVDPAGLAVAERHRDRWDDVVALARSGTASPRSSGAGRLFDAVAALCGAGDTVTYEAQAAIALEQLAGRARAHQQRPYESERSTDLVAAVATDLRAGRAPGEVAARFHGGLAALAERLAVAAAQAAGLEAVALSGGVFQNALLAEDLAGRLRTQGLEVLAHQLVPTNDGGISLGQAWLAGIGAVDLRP